ncbi:MAG: prepilin-type N-terminal cleavage/methylation domain-containing protein [Azoarcus sp.]|jgi:general secretion pathway protein J|nr:prepilin-type N-terminal cleavage/methylation domain-containing protein [Azoarcus sp.]
MIWRSSGARGFTLIEIIIALTIMSLIMLGLISAFATLGKTATRLDERAEQGSRQWLMNEFLRASLASSTGRFRQRLADESQAIFFRGEPQSLQWLGAMPPRYGAGGLHYFFLTLETENGVTRLVLRYAPYVADNSPDIAAIDARVLAENVIALRIFYQNRPEKLDEEAVWNELWDNPDKLPARVHIELAADGTTWPPVVAVMGGVDVGGSKRSSRSGSRSSVLGVVR